MIIGDRLKELREAKGFSQGVIEERTGLLRCYISRVENGHTVPAVETLEKFARALEVPMYQLFFSGTPSAKIVKEAGKYADAHQPVEDEEIVGMPELRRFLPKINERDRGILLRFAQMLAKTNRKENRKAA